MNNKECKICLAEFDRVASHVVRTHEISLEDYFAKYYYEGIRPSCVCGCGSKTNLNVSPGKGFLKFMHGHHAKGRVKSDDEKLSIGKKNSEKMIEFWKDHPELKEERGKQLNSGHTEETRKNNTETLVKWNRSEQGRKSASIRSRKLWDEQRDLMMEANGRATQTLRENIAAGLTKIGTEEWKQNISIGISKKYLEGGFEWSRGKYTSTKTGKMSYYRSSWEFRHMQDLDFDSMVSWWDYEPMIIPYVFERREHRYLPDFLVRYSDGHRELHEIGVGAIKSMKKNMAKEQAAIDWCLKNSSSYRQISF